MILKKLMVIVLLTGMVAACTKLKNTSYDRIISEQFKPESDDIGSLVGAAYIPWRSLFNKWQSYFWAQEICSDHLVIPKRPWGWVDDGGYRRFHYHSWTAEDAIISSCWQRAYSGVTACNRIIYQVENDQIPLGDAKKSTLAELKVLRATYYYVLCDLYGNVPIVDRFDVPENYLPEQNTRKQVFDFMVKDIKDNINDLKVVADQTTYGRVNKWVAFSLLAKLYLNAGVYTGTPMWNECIAACDSVIASGKYVLEPRQKNVFVTNNETSKEIIWAFVYDSKYLNQYWADWNAFDHHMQTLPQEMQRTYNLQNSPWGGICAIPQFIETFDQTNDDRFKLNWIRGVQTASNGEVLIVQNGAHKGQPLNLVNVLPSIDSTEANHGLRLGKFEVALKSASILDNDFPFFRYADIKMMKAECLLRTGKAADAAAIVTEVRTRSYSSDPSKASITAAELQQGSKYPYGQRDKYGNSNEGGADVQYGRFLDELGYEFFEEGRRRQDMIRFGVFTTKKWFSHTSSAAHRSLYPIPQVELNKNSKLKQNFGY
jgi:starch-binding outer membrane protein, SusD/RagB family